MKNGALKILLVEDDELPRHLLSKRLASQGHIIEQAASKAEAIAKIHDASYDLSFVDLDLDERRAGFEIIPHLKQKGVYSVILSAHHEADYVEEGYNRQCDDYLLKPIKDKALEEVLSTYRGSSQKARLRKFISQKLITQDPDHLRQYDMLAESFAVRIPIHITGPSGTGKSVLASALHEGWHANLDRFAEVSPDGLADNLLQSELFGHEDGAFTGARKKHLGKLSQADQGTLFIDEIGTIGPRMQNALLVPLASGNFSPVGSNARLHSDFKLITATCEDLYEKIANKKFREDFYNRIAAGIKVHFKPLCDRRKDIELLLEHVQKDFGRGRALVIKPSARKALIEYDWPGNEREFFQFWETKSKTRKPIFSIEDLPDRIVRNQHHGKNSLRTLTEKQVRRIEEIGFKAFVAEAEKELVAHFRKLEGKDRPLRALMRHFGYGQAKVEALLDQADGIGGHA